MLWFAFRGQDLNKLIKDLSHANYWWVLLSILISILAHYIRAVRWNMLIKPLGYEPKNSTTFYAVMVGYIANLAFPRMGEVSRCGVLTKTDKIPLNSLLGTVIIERVIDLVFLFIVIALSVIFQFEIISGFLYKNLLEGMINKITNNTLTLITIILIAIAFVIVAVTIYRRFKVQIMKSSLAQKGINLVKGIREGITSVRKMENNGLFALYSVAIWVCYYLSSYFCFFAIDATSTMSPLIALFILAVGGLGMSAPVQGGIGAYHWIVSQALILFGVSQTDGLAYATINHSGQTLSVLIVGGISLILVFAVNNKKSDQPDLKSN
jgi:glycosyltransferase 2 family protein